MADLMIAWHVLGASPLARLTWPDVLSELGCRAAPGTNTTPALGRAGPWGISQHL